MCLTTDQKRPFIALFRPTVWKVLIQENDGRIYTPVQIAKVKLCKKLVNEEEPEFIKDYGSQKLKYLASGFFHSFCGKEGAIRYAEELSSYERCSNVNKIFVVKAYLPLFTKYYRNETQCASRKIYYTDKIVFEVKIKTKVKYVTPRSSADSSSDSFGYYRI